MASVSYVSPLTMLRGTGLSGLQSRENLREKKLGHCKLYASPSEGAELGGRVRAIFPCCIDYANDVCKNRFHDSFSYLLLQPSEFWRPYHSILSCHTLKGLQAES